jgi:cysteinyl-tRNA synthetase
MIWKSPKEFEDEEQISQAREVLRGMIVQLGLRLNEVPKDIPSVLSPIMEVLLEVRGKLRAAKQWEMADTIRQKLSQTGILIEDTPQGPKWYIKEKG